MSYMIAFSTLILVLYKQIVFTTAQANLATLQACLGPKLTNQLVTQTQSFSANIYYQYNWLKSGL